MNWQHIPFTIQRKDHNDISILFISGRMESADLTRLKQELRQLTEQRRLRLILDFSELVTVSSLTMAGLVLEAESYRAHGGEMKLAGVSREIMSVVQMLKLDERVEVQPDVVAAIKSMSGAGSSKSTDPVAAK